MRGSKKRYAAVGLLVTGLLTLGMGFALRRHRPAPTGNEDCPAGTVPRPPSSTGTAATFSRVATPAGPSSPPFGRHSCSGQDEHRVRQP